MKIITSSYFLYTKSRVTKHYNELNYLYLCVKMDDWHLLFFNKFKFLAFLSYICLMTCDYNKRVILYFCEYKSYCKPNEYNNL